MCPKIVRLTRIDHGQFIESVERNGRAYVHDDEEVQAIRTEREKQRNTERTLSCLDVDDHGHRHRDSKFLHRTVSHFAYNHDHLLELRNHTTQRIFEALVRKKKRQELKGGHNGDDTQKKADFVMNMFGDEIEATLDSILLRLRELPSIDELNPSGNSFFVTKSHRTTYQAIIKLTINLNLNEFSVKNKIQ
jgi:hypothetical protein